MRTSISDRSDLFYSPMIRNLKGIYFAAVLCGFALVANGCGSKTSPPGTIDAALTNCSSETAEILVGDGFMRISCGCVGANETSGTVFFSPDVLTCHVPTSRTRVFFAYLGTVLPHQIVADGTPAIVNSAFSDPNSNAPLRFHSTDFKTPASTYQFKDNFSPLKGQIVVP